MSRLSGVFMALALVVAVGAGVLLAQGGGRAVAVVFVAAIAAFVAIPAWRLFKDQEKSWIGKRLKLKRADARDVGSFLLTGVVLAIAVGLLQITLDIAREREARDEQFRLSVGVSENLAGLDARGESLSGLSLSGKNLSRADLRDADLTDTNLESASLRDADLRGADLEGASLFRADLAGALLRGANLKDADLRFARMPYAGIYAVEDYGLAELDGALVNSRTCFPPDIITGRDEAEEELRGEIVQEPTEVRGRELEPAGPPYQCPFTFNNLIDHVREHKAGRTYLQLAKPWREKARQIAKIFEKPGSDPPTADQLTLERPVCVGSHHVAIRRREQWAPNGAFALVVGQPGKRRRNTLVVPLSVKPGGALRTPITLEAPVKRGSELMLFATPSTDPGAPNSALRTEVKPKRC